MVVLTKEQWYQKLRGWLPAWWFEQERYNVAVLKAMARVFAEAQSIADAHVRETFIQQSTGEITDLHGDERSVERGTDEPDRLYDDRIVNINLPRKRS